MGCGKDRSPAVFSSPGSSESALAPFPLPKTQISFRAKLSIAVYVTVFRVKLNHVNVFQGLLQHLKRNPKPSSCLPLQK